MIGSGLQLDLAGPPRVSEAEERQHQQHRCKGDDRAVQGKRSHRGERVVQEEPAQRSPWSSVSFCAANVWQSAVSAAAGSEHEARYSPLISEYVLPSATLDGGRR